MTRIRGPHTRTTFLKSTLSCSSSSSSPLPTSSMDPQPKAKHYEIDKDDNELEDNNSPSSSSSSSKRRAIAFISSSTPATTTTAAASAARKVEPAALNCQADKCSADLSDAKKYLRRHKVCQAHFKAPVVIVAGIRKRFCQQCSKFHELSEFDETKRSCRRRLAGHNERRRKTSSESKGEGSSGCRQADQGGGAMNISLRGNPAYKNFQIR